MAGGGQRRGGASEASSRSADRSRRRGLCISLSRGYCACKATATGGGCGLLAGGVWQPCSPIYKGGGPRFIALFWNLIWIEIGGLLRLCGTPQRLDHHGRSGSSICSLHHWRRSSQAQGPQFLSDLTVRNGWGETRFWTRSCCSEFLPCVGTKSPPSSHWATRHNDQGSRSGC